MMPLFPKEPKPRNSGRSPLFDRLCGSSAWLDETDVRRSIARELRRILSSRTVTPEWRQSPARGMRVMAWNELLTRDPKSEAFIIEREIRRRVERLEPRLQDVAVELVKHGHKRYVVRVDGKFRVSPQHPPSRFQTTVDYMPSTAMG